MVGADVLVILDGASEPWDGTRPTSLERARTPALDALARDGTLARARTVPAGLDPGSETAIPVLLGWVPTAPVDRGAIEAAAHAIDVPAGERAWRVDVVAGEGSRADGAAARRTDDAATGRADGAAARRADDAATGRADGAAARRADDAATGRAARRLRHAAPRHAVHHLRGHRLLLVGPPPLPPGALAPGLRAWAEGIVLPRTLDATTVVVAARGAAAGIATLLGAEVVVPAGATGDAATDLAAKLATAVAALDAGASTVVVHVGGADEAAHARDAAGKLAFLERADRELLAPLAGVVARSAGTLRVCPDHGCDPATGRHDAHPVPHLTWHAAQPGTATDAEHRLTWHAAQPEEATDAEHRLTWRATQPGAATDAEHRLTWRATQPGAATDAEHRLTERAVAALAVTDLTATVTAAA